MAARARHVLTGKKHYLVKPYRTDMTARETSDPVRPIDRLLEIMTRLRDPEAGCPWDLQQTFATIAPYTNEEAYEVADAIEHGDMDCLRDELGDLLLQVVFHARIAEEDGAFNFADVADSISEKMVRRHPHVFGDVAFADDDAQHAAWEDEKAAERAARGEDASALSGVPIAHPALVRAEKLGKRAARVGFDWPDAIAVKAKVREELDELDAARDSNEIEEELGDLLFAVSQLGRKLKVDPESALRRANAKFERRFHHMEAALAKASQSIEDASMDTLESLWNAAKAAEKV